MIEGNILITGGAGTLGRVLATVALEERWPCRITVYSRSEYLQASMRSKFPSLRYVIGDVRDFDRLSAAVAGHDIVIHAAAMKRIPECEQFPDECWKTNVLGSSNIAKACSLHGVRRCIGISTDKACRAVTMYGASKLAMEKLFRGANVGGTKFSLVRYGNVVASRGSVIPIWRKQRDEGQEITVTNPDMTRFWMSPRYAAKVIVDGLRQPEGSVLVPKLKSLSLIQMMGFIVGDVRSKIIGLRSEEKKHEDLVQVDENVQDLGEYFRIGTGSQGCSYTSDRALRVTKQEFLDMITEAESFE